MQARLSELEGQTASLDSQIGAVADGLAELRSEHLAACSSAPIFQTQIDSLTQEAARAAEAREALRLDLARTEETAGAAAARLTALQSAHSETADLARALTDWQHEQSDMDVRRSQAAQEASEAMVALTARVDGLAACTEQHSAAQRESDATVSDSVRRLAEFGERIDSFEALVGERRAEFTAALTEARETAQAARSLSERLEIAAGVAAENLSALRASQLESDRGLREILEREVRRLESGIGEVGDLVRGLPELPEMPELPDLSPLAEQIGELSERADALAEGVASAQASAATARSVAADAMDSTAEVRSLAEELEASQKRLFGDLGDRITSTRDEMQRNTEVAIEQSTAEVRAVAAEVRAEAAEVRADIRSTPQRISRLAVIDGESLFTEGSYGIFGNSTYRALKATRQTPAGDEESWEVIAAGCDNIEVETEDGRIQIFAVIAGKRSVVADTRIPFIAGPWEDGRTYYPQQIVIRKGSQFHCEVETQTDPGSEAGVGYWRLAVQRGEKGDRGERGRKGIGIKGDDGEAGVGIAEMVSHAGAMVVSLTDGSVKRFDLSKTE